MTLTTSPDPHEVASSDALALRPLADQSCNRSEPSATISSTSLHTMSSHTESGGDVGGLTPPRPSFSQRFRTNYAEYIAEAFGSAAVILFGAGAQLQSQLFGSATSTHLGEHTLYL